MKPNPDFLILLNQFNETLRNCRAVFVDGGREVVEHYPHLLSRPGADFLNMMDDLHRGLMLKLFVEIGGSDGLYTEAEEHLAGVLFFHLWHRQLGKSEVRDSLRHVASQAASVKWPSLVRPFAEIEPLRYRIPELETAIVRIGNLIARSDGRATSLELEALKAIQTEILDCLGSALRDRGGEREPTEQRRPGNIEIRNDPSIGSFPDGLAEDPASESNGEKQTATPSKPSQPDLKESLDKLEKLIGLSNVKNEIKTLVNFLKVQQSRTAMGLPANPVTLHMVFAGNPGTGKTTVARILGEIYAALGLLEKGHLVETDRAGLVAEYAGQTAVKTERLVDQALGGLLFIDEAYSLAASDRDDPYGAEAVQKLLKRMEDDRQRLVIVLAGYPEKMDRLLRSNPGLSSRFPHHITFPDYTPPQLAWIFEGMCDHNQYRMDGLTRARLQAGFEWMFERRDEHFGNGRTARNLFEQSIRRLANRVVESREMSRDLLSRFEPSDIEFEGVPRVHLDLERLESLRYSTHCPDCMSAVVVGCGLLGRRVECRRCKHQFRIGWCEPANEDSHR